MLSSTSMNYFEFNLKKLWKLSDDLSIVYGLNRKFDKIYQNLCFSLPVSHAHPPSVGYNSNIYVEHSVWFRHFVWVTRIRDRWQFPGHAIKSGDYFTDSCMNAYIRYTFSAEQEQQKSSKHWINVCSFEKRAKKYDICLIKTNSCCCSALYLMVFFRFPCLCLRFGGIEQIPFMIYG